MPGTSVYSSFLSTGPSVFPIVVEGHGLCCAICGEPKVVEVVQAKLMPQNVLLNPEVVLCPGNDDCGYGPNGADALPCQGWSGMCCRCGASYAQGQL